MKALLERLYLSDTLTRQEAHDLMARIAAREIPEAQIASLLTVYRMRPVSTEEMLGFRDALLERALPVDLSAYKALDIVGTGGDGKNTFNISTCACFVVAGAGYKVAKHGNYGASSVSGASTVLELHGVKFTNDPDRIRRSIEGCGMTYLHAPLFHPALAAVGPVRRALGVKTVFNLLGPLVNPSHNAYQLLGVADIGQMRLYQNVLQQVGLGFTIVTSIDGYDEISLTADFKIVSNDTDSIVSPAELGFDRATPQSLSGGATPEEAAAIFDHVLSGEGTDAQTNCVLATAAYGIHTICPNNPIAACLDEAREALDNGAAKRTFDQFVALNS